MEARAGYDVTIERDASGMPTRLFYSRSTPVYPAIGVITVSAPCASCGGVVGPHPTYDDLQLCTGCGLRRMRPTVYGPTKRALADVALTIEQADELLRLIEESRQHSTLTPRDLPTAKPAAATDDRREALAAYAHEAWSGWMNYLFQKSNQRADGSVVIPTWAVERWYRQMMTDYDDLPENEKASDRAEAGKMVALMPAAAKDDAIRNRHAELLHMLQEHGDVSDAWCVAEMAALDRVLLGVAG